MTPSEPALSPRPGGVRLARRLDVASVELRGIPLTGLALGAGIMAGSAGDAAVAMLWFAIWAPVMFVDRACRLDDEGGAALRSILPLLRRDVVTARFAGAAVLLGWWVLGWCLTSVGVALAGAGAPGADAVSGLWCGTWAFVITALTGLRLSVSVGRAATSVLAVVGGVGGLVVSLVLRQLLWGDTGPADVTDLLVAAAGCVVLVAAGGWLTHRATVRAYEKKDL